MATDTMQLSRPRSLPAGKSGKSRAKSVMMDTSKTAWATMDLPDAKETKKFSEARNWRQSKGNLRAENSIMNLLGTYQVATPEETANVTECCDCETPFNTTAKKYFCAECEQVYCSKCINKRKKDEDGNNVWVCQECYWG